MRLLLAILFTWVAGLAQADSCRSEWRINPGTLSSFISSGFAVVGTHSHSWPDGRRSSTLVLQKGPHLVKCREYYDADMAGRVSACYRLRSEDEC